MSATVAQLPKACSKGKPVELVIEHFELALEHLQVLEHDAETLEKAMHALTHLRGQMGRLESFVHDRLVRMQTVLKPEAQRFVESANARCESRK